MSSITDLLARLEKSGVPLTEEVKTAMKYINPDKFTDHDLEHFWEDRPTLFFITELGSGKTISAPHMIITMLYHLELLKGQDILIMGSKGGYLAALADFIIGEKGSVTIVEPHAEVRNYTRERIENHETRSSIEIYSPIELIESEKKFDRILITGFLKEITDDIRYHVKDGGFILGPIGSSIHQRLIKKEKQDTVWMDTDLGGVVFGPMDLAELEKNPLDPENIIEHMEVALEMVLEVIEIEEESLKRIDNLILSLKELPKDIPILDEFSTEEEILEHPVMELLLSEQAWLGPLWSILTGLEDIGVSDFSTLSGEDYSSNGGHSDLIP